MHDAAVEEIGDGREPDMRMRPHVHALAGDELHRPHLVEEDERPDHLPLAMRQRAPHLEAAEIAHARHDDELQRVAGALVAEDRIVAGCQLMTPPETDTNAVIVGVSGRGGQSMIPKGGSRFSEPDHAQ